MNGRSCGLRASWRLTNVSVSCSVRMTLGSEPRSRSVAIRRSPMTRSVSSLTTQSIPTRLPSSSRSGL
ncbi:hypothetical protein M2303_006319 [Micromonospora sp. H404/HB375]|nr:hypothetical protein [Micromonospora sp. H404/HB375]